jgi:ABC-type transporter Mla subunit MlaD
MSELTSAQIIPFPTRAPLPDAATEAPAEPSQAEARLSRALNGLNNALTAQRAAMDAWKSALGDLRTVTGRLGASLRSYNDSLGHLDERVKTLRTEAVKLEAWADGALEKKG